jgi:vitamin B12 transporter
MTRIPSASLSLRSCCLAGAALVLLALPAAAQQSAGTLPPLVVTPTKAAVPLDEVGSSITVITREEIEEQNFQTLPDLLNAVPGLHVVQTGPQGALTSVFTRGSNSNQTLVLLNGRPIGDPSASNGAFNFAHLPLFNVEQVEVLRGPASALYGSKAIGGVINVLTRQGEGDPRFGAQVEVGTQNTLNTIANANGRLAGIGYDLTLSRLATDGFSVTADNLTPPGATVEADGYRNLAGSLALDAELTENLSVSFFGAILDTRADTDYSEEDPNGREITRQYLADAALAGSFFEGFWRPTLSFGYSNYFRNDKDAPDALDVFGPSSADVDNRGWRASAELQNDFVIDEQNTLTVGSEFERESFSAKGLSDFGGGFVVTQDSEADRDTVGVYAIHRFNWEQRLFVSSAVRFDSPENTDSAITYTLSPLYHFKETGTKLRGSVGTGYKAPSLYELYGFSPTSFGNAFVGNPDLEPERSFGWEVGFDQALFEDRLILGATYFRSRIRDAINTEFDPLTFDSTTVNNRDLAVQGAEVYLDIMPLESVRLHLDYTFTHAILDDTEKQALRRPKHQVNATLAIDLTDALTITGNALLVGGQRDIGYFGGEKQMPAYTVINAAISYDLFDGVTAYARAENLLDEDYETADGFQAPGVRLLVGLRASY